VPFNVSRPTALALVCALLAILVLAGNRLAHTGTAAAPDVAAAPLEPLVSARSENVVVHVVGAVRRPGLYHLHEGQRVADAVTRAGGPTRKADLTALNLAAPLVDGTQVLVPARVSVAAAGVAPGASASGTAGAGATAGSAQPKVSLATATLEQLDALPGVGPVTAQKIIDYRTEHGAFRSVDDLDQVPGIGPARVENLRDLVTP
jgi:competence protein ComEA